MMVTVLAMCDCSNYCHYNRLKLEDNRPIYCSVMLKFLDFVVNLHYLTTLVLNYIYLSHWHGKTKGSQIL